MHITRIILIVTLQITASVAFGGTDFTVVDSGRSHSIGLKSDGTLWTWGYNFDGQLGNSNNNDTNTPVKIGSDTNWTAISAGNYHTIGLKSDGTLWTWGFNPDGQLGNGTNNNTNTPGQSSGAPSLDYTAGKQFCIDDPTSCGIESGGDFYVIPFPVKSK